MNIAIKKTKQKKELVYLLKLFPFNCLESLSLQNQYDLAMMAKSNRGLRNNKY